MAWHISSPETLNKCVSMYAWPFSGLQAGHSRCLPDDLSMQYLAGLLFDWLYPAHFPTLRACLEAWADSPDVTTAMLKFMAEFATNKTQRLTFDSSSPNGILLFREVSKVSIPTHPGFRQQPL